MFFKKKQQVNFIENNNGKVKLLNSPMQTPTVKNVNIPMRAPTVENNANSMQAPIVKNINSPIRTPRVKNINSPIQAPTVENNANSMQGPIVKNINSPVQAPIVENNGTVNKYPFGNLSDSTVRKYRELFDMRMPRQSLSVHLSESLASINQQSTICSDRNQVPYERKNFWKNVYKNR